MQAFTVHLSQRTRRRFHVRYPFAAVVGHRAARQALLLLAVEPRLKGALIASENGSADSLLARDLGSLLPSFTRDSIGSATDYQRVSELVTDAVEIPLNITEDRLLGALDLERTISTGKREISTGLLAAANGRVMYASDINLLDAGTVVHIANALDSGYVRLEREGLSAIHDADFMFVGTYDPDEGEPSSLLRERVGLIIVAPSECSADERAEITARAIGFSRNPYGFADDFAFETALLKGVIEEARERLPRVRISKNLARQLAQIAVSLGVEGNRIDLFALRAARANAALAGRDAITEDDLVAAIQLVFAPRATALPPPLDNTRNENESSQPDNAEDDDSSSERKDDDRDSLPGAIEDLIVQAIDARVPNDLLSSVETASRPSRRGKRFKASMSGRGRYVRSTINRTREARVAIDATLRAAAPFQLGRRVQGAPTSRQSSAREAAPESDSKYAARRIRIEPADLRFKRFKHRSGVLFIFAVDASGSMALNRMAQAKGAVTRLLQQAYLHRDKVALISFRGASSDVLLAPTRSVELAKRLVDALPAGGGTPLSAGVVKAIELARLAQLRGLSQAMLVLFTDGRANVGLDNGRAGSTISDELRQLGSLLASNEIKSLVVDTKSRFVSSGEGQALARVLGARYFYLPRSDAAAVCNVIATATGRLQTTDDR